MDNEKQQVTEKIENGSYFTEALDWYNGRYVFVQTQFSQMLIVAIISLTAFFFTLFGFFGFLPVTDKKLFVVYHSLNPETSIKLKSLMEAGENPDHALSIYWLGEYVKSREEYIVERSERDFNLVYNMSAHNVLEDYLSFVSPDNANSPFVVYANRGTRNIEIKKVVYFDENGREAKHAVAKGKAEILFAAKENFGAQGQKSVNYTANLEFNYKKVEVDQKTHELTAKPEMVITSYTTKLSSK